MNDSTPPPMPRSQPPPMPTNEPGIADNELSLSVENSVEATDTIMSSMPLALLIQLSIAGVMVIVGFAEPRLSVFAVPVFAVCGVWVATKGLKLSLSLGLDRLLSQMSLFGLQVAAVGASGLVLAFIGVLMVASTDYSDAKPLIRMVLFLFSIIYFPSAIYLRHQATKHLRQRR